MAGLKDNFPGIAQGADSGYKVTPDEIDQDQTYYVLHPDVAANGIGTAAAGTVNVAWTIVGTPDYPRNLKYSVTGPAGGVGGTCIVNGTDQFGNTIQETITLGSANAGGTVEGTKVFNFVTSGTHYPNGGDNTGTAVLGFAIGTSSTSPKFGLPVKLGATADVKKVVWVDNDVTKQSTFTVDTTNHAVILPNTGGVAEADSYVITYRSSYNTSGDAQVFNT